MSKRIFLCLLAWPCAALGQTGQSASRNLHLNGNATQAITQAFAAYGMQVLFPTPLSNTAPGLHLDLREIDLSPLGRFLGPLTQTFFVPLDTHTVLALPDDREHRARYEHPVTETVEIPSLPAKEGSSVATLLTGLFSIRNP